jgi:hypothetical protein
MKKLPLSIILLLMFMAFFYNLERLDVGSQSLVNINTFVYGLLTIDVIFTVMLRIFKRRNIAWVLTFWMVVYFTLKIFIFKSQPVWGGYSTYITLIEVGMVLSGTVLARWLGWNLNDFENAVENITFSEIKRASNLKEATDSINNEIYRSRRYNHPLTMIVVEPLKGSQEMILNQSVREVQESMISRYVSISLARALHDHIRRTDLLIEQPDKGRFIVMTPETDKLESDKVISKIEAAAASIGAEVAVGVCSFPDEALTLEDMLTRADMDLAENVIRTIAKEHGSKETEPSP